MCRLFVGVKLVLIKLLLASISGLTSLTAYEYGYHPSAEEFDGVLRDTHRTWTHDILNLQTQRELYKKSPPTNEVRSYVPKFQYENNLKTFKPNQKRHDLQKYTTTSNLNTNKKGTIQNLGSTLNFHYGNDDDDDGEDVYNMSHSLSDDNNSTETRVYVPESTSPPELNLKPLTKPEIEKYSLNNLYKNNSHAHFPIYFTNPATGIVYAITEMGKSADNLTHKNGTIPIFITKEQYERDILLLKQEYEHKCGGQDGITHKKPQIVKPSSFSVSTPTTTTTTTTMRPTIIRLKKPFTSAQLSTMEFLTPFKKPSPVLVRKEITVKDLNNTTPRPLRKKRKQKNKKKTRKTKPPGHQTTPRPNSLVLAATSGAGITIVNGIRTTTKRPNSDFYKLSTQLEKPNLGTTIYSVGALPATASTGAWNNHLYFNNRGRSKRSTDSTNLNEMVRTFKNTDTSLSQSSDVIKQKTESELKSNEILEFQRKWIKNDLIQNSKYNNGRKNVRSVDPKNTDDESESKIKKYLGKSDDRPLNEKHKILTKNILVNFNPKYQNVDKKELKHKNNSIQDTQKRNMSDTKFEEILKQFLKPVEGVNYISDYSAASRKKSDKLREEFTDKLENFTKSVNGTKSLAKTDNGRISGEIKMRYFDENYLKSLKISKNLNRLVKKISNFQFSNLPINRNISNNNFQKFLNLINKNSNDSQNVNSLKNSKAYLKTSTATISDKLDFDIENSNKKTSENSKQILENIFKSANEVEKIQNVSNKSIKEKLFPKYLNVSEVLPVLNVNSKTVNFEVKHNPINNISDKVITNNVIDKKLLPQKENQFKNSLKKDFMKSNAKLKNRKFKIVKYPIKETITKNNISEKIKDIDKNISIHTKIQFKNGLMPNENMLVKSDCKTDKYSNEKCRFYRISENSKVIDKTKQIPNYLNTKKFMATDQIFVKSKYRKKVNIIKLSNANPKSSDNSSKKGELARIVKLESTGNVLHHIGKRSVTDPKRNVTAPKFVKKSYNSIGGNSDVIDSTTVNTSTESVLEIKPQISIKFKDLVNNSNRTNLNNRFQLNSKRINSKNSTSIQKTSPSVKKRKRNRPRKKFQNSRNRTKTLKKRKRIKLHTSKKNIGQNDTSLANSNNTETSTARNIKEAVTKMVTQFMDNKRAKHSQGAHDYFDTEDNDEDDKDDEEGDDDDDGEDSDEDDDDEDDLKEVTIHDNTSSAEEGADFGALEEEEVTNAEDKTNFITEHNEPETKFNITEDDVKKRLRRRPTQATKSEDDYDEDDDEDSSMGSNLGGFFRMIFYPVQIVMSSLMDTILGGKEPEEQSINPYTQYTSYHNTLKQHSSDDYSYDNDDDDEDYDNYSSESSIGDWLGSWFGLKRRNKKISSTTVAPLAAQRKPTKQSNNWFQSWFGIGDNDGVDKTDTVSTEDYTDYDKWFASWFGEIKPKARKRTTTTTTSTTTHLPQIPILTIVDPMRNPQNWIGILAHHIINQTSSTTQNPLRDVWTRMTTPETTTTTTENPEIPRKISYNKYQIWRLKPQDDSQVQALEEYKKGDGGIKLQWLKGPSLRGLTDVLVPPRMLVDFQSSLTFESIDHEVLIFDVGKAIGYEKSKEDYFFTTTQKPKKKHQNRHTHKPPAAMTWMRYYEFDDIVTFMESMRMRYPQLVELIHIGRSYEGRPLIVMKIESKEAAATNSAQYLMHEKAKLRHKKRIGLANAVFIEGGTHGMEWIAPATATWIINELLKLMKTNKTSSDEANLIRNTTWFIMPVLNPDGYVYSHEYDRFWKKSRSRHISRPSGLINSAMTWLQKKKTKDKVCFGVDLDRNWNYQWGKRGSSKAPCNEFFAGPGPFSEPETKALSEFLMDYRTHVKLYISMQAYGQIISYPYKANTTYDTERLDDFLDVAMVGTDGLRKKGSKSRYKIDSTNDLVENRSGCSDAFVAYDVGIPFSYTLQLADNGVHGYLLPSSSIESTSKDAFEIITAMLDYI